MGLMQRSTHARLRRGCQYEEATGQKAVFRVAPGHHSAARCRTALCGAGVP